MLSALARKFDPTTRVAHEPNGCRKLGAAHCTYRIATAARAWTSLVTRDGCEVLTSLDVRR